MFFFWRRKEPLSAQAQLMKWFRFDSKDLTANQEGSLSEGQYVRLFDETTLWWKSGLLAVGYMSICTILSMLVPSLRRETNPVVGSVVVIGIILAIAAFHALRLRQDIRHNTVESVTGWVIRRERRRGFIIQNAKSERQFDRPFPSIDLTQPYTIYYLPLSRRIVSAEDRPDLAPESL